MNLIQSKNVRLATLNACGMESASIRERQFGFVLHGEWGVSSRVGCDFAIANIESRDQTVFDSELVADSLV